MSWHSLVTSQEAFVDEGLLRCEEVFGNIPFVALKIILTLSKTSLIVMLLTFLAYTQESDSVEEKRVNF
jgi:hypothetical protein